MTGPEYKRISTAVLIVALAALTLPLLYPLMAKSAPFAQCPSLTVFNNPCPMCGLTRGFYNIWQMDLPNASRLNMLSIPLFIFFLLEAAFRVLIIMRSDRLESIDRIARLDLRIHILLTGCYFAYSICFVVFRWKLTL